MPQIGFAVTSSERGGVEDQPPRAAIFVSAAAGTLPPRTQPRAVLKSVIVNALALSGSGGTFGGLDDPQRIRGVIER